MSPCTRCFWINLVLALGLGSVVGGAGRRKVIVDQDAFGPGGSNLQAILMLLQSPDVEVLGVTIESGDGWRDENVAYTLRMFELVERTDVPVVPGATWPLINTPEATRRWEVRYGKLVYKGAWTEQWPESATVKRPSYHDPNIVPPLAEGAPTTKPLSETAAAFLVRQVHEHPHEVTILALGPLTNLALAARLDDNFTALAKELVFMGGSFRPTPAANEFALEYMFTPRLEFNFRWDPEATKIVLHAAWARLTQVPVDPTTRTLFTPELKRRATASGTPVARYVAQYGQTFPMWDELAVAVWLDPSLVTHGEKIAVDVDTDAGAGYGNTLSWPAGKGPGLGERDATVVFEVDVPRLEQLVVRLFNQPPGNVK
jgi:inosine-uridine nucleoside N-ribohydrolase